MRKPLPQAPLALAGSLATALAQVADPRHPDGGRPGAGPIPLVALRQLVVAAMQCGAHSLNAVA